MSTEIASRGFFARLRDAIGGVLVGIVLALAAVALLWWNEGRAVKTAKGLKEGASEVIPVPAGTVSSTNDGRLVHVAGQAVSLDTLRDPVLGVGERAIALIRDVEMYQWNERSRSEKRTRGGGREEEVTTYTYHSEWSPRLIDSSGFHDPTRRNPAAFPVAAETFRAARVTVGAFRLNMALIGQIGGAEPYPLDASHATALPAHLRDRPVDARPEWLYLGHADTPQIGDLRLRSSIVRDQPVSLLARQIAGTFEPYGTERGTTIQRLMSGTMSAEAMFGRMEGENTRLAWGLRVLGVVLMTLGIGMVLKPFKVALDILPLLGALAGLATGLVALVLALMASLATMAVAWLFYRPLLSVTLFALGVAVYFGARKLAGRKWAVAGAETATT